MRRVLAALFALLGILVALFGMVAHALKRVDPERYGDDMGWLVIVGVGLLFILVAVAFLRKSKSDAPSPPPS